MQQSNLFGPFMSCEETKVLQKGPWLHISIYYTQLKNLKGQNTPAYFAPPSAAWKIFQNIATTSSNSI